MFDENYSEVSIIDIVRDCIRLRNIRYHAEDRIYIRRHFNESIRIHIKVMADKFHCILAKGCRFHPKVVEKGKALSVCHVDYCRPDIKIIYPPFSIYNWHETFAERGLHLNLSIRELNEVYKQWTYGSPHIYK